MPINPKDPTFDGSISSVGFYQSNSLHSFNTKTNYSSIVSSKSSNCIGEGLIENEELIEKLFPKCRPKVKSSVKNESEVKKPAPPPTTTTVSQVSHCDQSSEMFNSSSLSSDNDTTQSGKSNRSSSRRSLATQNFAPSRRIWNFMDISPSPSPPPLSPIEDTDHHHHHYPSANYGLTTGRPVQDKPNNSTTEDYHRSATVEQSSLQADSEKIKQSAVTKCEKNVSRIFHSESRESGAKFRLDSLLMSSGDGRSESIGRKPVRIPLDFDDEDDVLFSRISSSKTLDKSQTNSKFTSKESLHSLGSDKCPQDSKNKVDCRLENRRFHRNSLHSQQCDSEQETKDDPGSRNRIELAGGKEIFSTSRGAKSAKRRSNSINCQLMRNHERRPITRHTQLYSVTMATSGDDNCQCEPQTTTTAGDFDQQTELCPTIDQLSDRKSTDKDISKSTESNNVCNSQEFNDHYGQCDQFTKDLKEKLNIVSNDTDLVKCEIDCDCGSDSDGQSAKSSSSTRKSFDMNVARVIGSVPIAQYEGSPKRYGPKPGYPKRIVSANHDCAPVNSEAEPVKKMATVLSSENGSPNSSINSSSSSSATFSSTDIHSSSSFSYPSNCKPNGGYSNWKCKPKIVANYNKISTTTTTADPAMIEDRISNNAINEITCDDVVKSILSIPSAVEQLDSDEEEDNGSVCSEKLPPRIESIGKELNSSNSNNNNTEPLYSTINFTQTHFGQKKPSVENCLKRDSEKMATMNGCEFTNSTRSVTSVKPYIDTRDPPPKDGDGGYQDRIVPKSLRLTNYPHILQASQSFESTDSSYRSDKYAGKDYYYTHSDDDSYETKKQPPPVQHVNGSDGRNLLETKQPLNYNCLSPELPKSESADCSTEHYPEAKCGTTNTNSQGDTEQVISSMPILEDGLSSGMPSSDDYEDEEECDDETGTQEQDLDEYVNEYHNRRTVIGCESSVSQPSGNRFESEMTNGSDYNYHYKQTDYGRAGGQQQQQQQQFGFRCLNKNSTQQQQQYELDLPEDKKDSYEHSNYYHAHHLHHIDHHVHNHPILDDSRPSLSALESTKHLPGSKETTPYNHDKYCLSTQLRPTSSSNNPGSNSRNSSNPMDNSNGKQQQQQQPPPPATSPTSGPHSHHHYHHYYHPQHSSQYNSAQQNYPNLSSSPTSLSPNSPGHTQHNPSSSSSSASSHQPPPPPPAAGAAVAAAAHHYHQQPATAGGSQAPSSQSQQEMPLAESPVNSLVANTTTNVRHHHDEDCDTDQETDRLLGSQRNDDRYYDDKHTPTKRSNTSREARFERKVLIEGVLFRARYLGSTQLVCDGQPTKATRMMQAEEAVSRIKSLAPEGESQPSTEVDLFISTEKIMVLNTDLKEIMMDHALRTISYIADIGDLLVLMARRRSPIDDPTETGIKRIPKMICHVFESEEAQYIAQSIGQAFQVAYMEFLKANGIKDSSFLKEMDYQEVLNSQEIFGDELEMFAKREKQKEVIVPKQKGEILGIVIVESGWGSMLPTVVIANLAQSSPSARCGQLNIGDQIIAINGISLVGLPLSTCQAYVKNTKNQTAVKFTIVPCAPVVEVKIKRPDTKYQLGFSVQNGVICSLLRGGIAERGGVRVGHRIIEINGQSVVAVPHDRIVNLLATSVGEIHMKTMPTSMFRLLTGQESPSYM